MKPPTYGPDSVELVGPFECEECGGHVSLDATFLDQVLDPSILCPYCGARSLVPDDALVEVG